VIGLLEKGYSCAGIMGGLSKPHERRVELQGPRARMGSSGWRWLSTTESLSLLCVLLGFLLGFIFWVSCWVCFRHAIASPLLNMDNHCSAKKMEWGSRREADKNGVGSMGTNNWSLRTLLWFFLGYYLSVSLLLLFTLLLSWLSLLHCSMPSLLH